MGPGVEPRIGGGVGVEVHKKIPPPEGGGTVMHEIETLQGGLNDTIKAVAEEMEIKPSILKKAIRVAYKSGLGQTNKEHEELNTILETVGKTL